MKPTWNLSRVMAGLLAIPALIATFSGCSPKAESPASSPASTEKYPLPEAPLVADCEPGIAGGRLVIAVFGEPKTFNPITANESSSTDIIQRMFSALLKYDPHKQEVQPGLAQSWTVAADQKTWTFKLRKGVHWSDGRPLTADDVVFTWNDIIYNPAIDNVTRDLFVIDGKPFVVTKVDDHTVQVVTPEIYAPFLEFFGAGTMIMPKHALSGAVAGKRFESAYGIDSKPEALVCNGPYKLKEFKPGEFVLLERNPYYWEIDSKGQRLPYLATVVYTTVPNFDAMSLRCLKGESDVQEVIRPEELDRFRQETSKGRLTVAELGLQMERGFVWFNQNTNANPKTGKLYLDPKKAKWFRNTKFRQAISYAIDRESIIKSIYAGQAKPIGGFVSPANKKWFNERIRQYPYDPGQAQSLLAEIGIKDRNGDGFVEDTEGNEIEFALHTNAGNSMREKISVLIQEDLKRLGIRLIFQPLEFNTLVHKINTSYEYDAALLVFGSDSSDPASNLNMLKSDGFTHCWFPRQKSPSTEWEARIDWLMNAQIKSLDHAERKKHFDEVQAIMAEQVPLISLVSSYAYVAYRSNLANVRPTPLHSLRVTWNVEQLYFKKK